MVPMGNMPSEGAHVTEEETLRLEKRSNLKNTIAKLTSVDTSDEMKAKAHDLKGLLFDMSTEEENLEDLKESVGFYKARLEPNEERNVEIGAIKRHAWGDREIDIETKPNLTADAERVLRSYEWVTKDSDGPVGGSEILE